MGSYLSPDGRESENSRPHCLNRISDGFGGVIFKRGGAARSESKITMIAGGNHTSILVFVQSPLLNRILLVLFLATQEKYIVSPTLKNLYNHRQFPESVDHIHRMQKQICK